MRKAIGTTCRRCHGRLAHRPPHPSCAVLLRQMEETARARHTTAPPPMCVGLRTRCLPSLLRPLVPRLRAPCMSSLTAGDRSSRHSHRTGRASAKILSNCRVDDEYMCTVKKIWLRLVRAMGGWEPRFFGRPHLNPDEALIEGAYEALNKHVKPNQIFLNQPRHHDDTRELSPSFAKVPLFQPRSPQFFFRFLRGLNFFL